MLPYGIPEGDQVFVVSAPDSQGMTHGAVETSEATIDFLSENDIGALDCERAPDGEDRFLCSVPLTG